MLLLLGCVTSLSVIIRGGFQPGCTPRPAHESWRWGSAEIKRLFRAFKGSGGFPTTPRLQARPHPSLNGARRVSRKHGLDSEITVLNFTGCVMRRMAAIILFDLNIYVNQSWGKVMRQKTRDPSRLCPGHFEKLFAVSVARAAVCNFVKIYKVVSQHNRNAQGFLAVNYSI